MAFSTNTILVTGNRAEGRNEGIVASANSPKPGHLLDRDSAGKIIVHANAGRNATPMFALEDDSQGKGIDDAYAPGAIIQYHVAKPGDRIYAFLDTTQEVTPADFLESGAGGNLRKHTAQAVAEDGSASYTIYSRAIVGRPLESVTTTDAVKRILIEVL